MNHTPAVVMPVSQRWLPALAAGIGYLLIAGVVFAVGAFVNAFASFVLVPIILALGGAHFLLIRFRRSVPNRWPSLLAGNALLLAFLLSLVFLAFETYYRFLYNQTDAMVDTLVAAKWYQRYYHRNNIQVRDNLDYAFALTRGKRRVTFVGDSFAAGLGVRDVEERFVNRIRRRHPEWEVHLVAQPG